MPIYTLSYLSRGKTAKKWKNIVVSVMSYLELLLLSQVPSVQGLEIIPFAVDQMVCLIVFRCKKNPYTCSTRHCTEYIILFFFSLMIMCYLPVSCAEYSLPISRHILLTLLDASTGIYIFSGISKHSGILTSTLYSIHFWKQSGKFCRKSSCK